MFNFFIDRPIFSSVISLIITLAGAVAALDLPITQYPQIVQAACDVLLEDGATQGRMLGLGVHPWLSGQAHRIKYLKAALADVMARPGVWHADGQAIAAHYAQWLGHQSVKEQA